MKLWARKVKRKGKKYAEIQICNKYFRAPFKKIRLFLEGKTNSFSFKEE